MPVPAAPLDEIGLGADDSRHGGPELLAVAGHLLKRGATNRLAMPVVGVVGLVDQIVADDGAVPDERGEIDALVTVDAGLPFPHVEVAAPVLVVILVPGQGEDEDRKSVV